MTYATANYPARGCSLPEPKLANERYGDAVVAILKGATRVEIVRIQPQVELRKPVQRSFGSFVVSATIEKGETEALAVGKAILEDAQKPPPEAANLFRPAIGFRLWKDKEYVNILLDVASHNLQVIGYDADGKVLKQTLNVARPATFNALLKLGQTAFPDDAALHWSRKWRRNNGPWLLPPTSPGSAARRRPVPDT